MYDVIVVGAGPAGTSAAKAAAESGLETLLIERELEVGVPDKCGEFIPGLDEMRRLAPDARNLQDLFDPPEHCIVNRTRYVKFIFPNDVEISVDFSGVVVERKLFDKHLANEAARAGAEILMASKAYGLLEQGKGVKVKTLDGPREIKSDVVIAADGAYSLIAREAGLQVSRDPLDYGVGFQYEMVNIDHDPEYVDMYIGEDIAPGTYAWIIPKGDDIANVGTGMRAPYMRKGLSVRDYQRNFIEKNPASAKKLKKAKTTAVKAGCIPVGGPLAKTYTDNILAVGDAAGQTIPTVGGGIPPGLICGRIAGETAALHLVEKTPLEAYEEAWRSQMGKTLENSLRIRKMSDIVFKNTKMIDWITKRGWLTKDMVETFILCEFDNKMKLVEKSLSMVGLT